MTTENKLLGLRYKSYLQEAKRVGVCLDISYEKFCNIILGPCHYCGELGKSGNYIEITRHDSQKCYDEENTIGCCRCCSKTRNEITIEKLLLTQSLDQEGT